MHGASASTTPPSNRYPLTSKRCNAWSAHAPVRSARRSRRCCVSSSRWKWMVGTTGAAMRNSKNTERVSQSDASSWLTRSHVYASIEKKDHGFSLISIQRINTQHGTCQCRSCGNCIPVSATPLQRELKRFMKRKLQRLLRLSIPKHHSQAPSAILQAPRFQSLILNLAPPYNPTPARTQPLTRVRACAPVGVMILRQTRTAPIR